MTFSRKSIGTFLGSLLLGQLLALILTAQNTISTLLSTTYALSIPTTQSTTTYILLFIVHTPYAIYASSLSSFWTNIRSRWIIYLLLGVVDVEANYFFVKSFSLTSMLSSMLLNTWATPTVVLLSLVFLRVRYHILHYIGVVGVVAGMFVLILSDAQSLNTPAANAFLGDVLALIGSTGYGVSNVLVEKYVANTSVSEVLSQMGMYGTLVSIIQLFVLERQEVLDAPWSAASIGVLAVFGILSFSFYTLAPVLFRMAGATFFNISLQTSNLYGLIIGLVFFDAKMTVLYGVAYVLFIVGILVYNTKAPLYLDQLEKKVDV